MKRLLFTNQTAIVTGAGGGLGRIYALELAKRGCNVVVNDVGGSLGGNTTDVSPAKKVVDEIISLGGKAVANFDSVLDGQSIVNQAYSTFGDVHILINNAGILRDKSFAKMSKEDWDKVINVHVNGAFNMCYAIWPKFQNNNYGRIVNIGSGAGLYGSFGQASYSTAKMGIVGLTNTLAKEGDKHNIKVNCVVPIAASRMTATVLPSEVLELLDPKHVAPIVTLLSHESSKTTGTIFEVGGGWYSKVRLQRSKGIKLGSNNQPCSAEDIADNLENICDFDSSTPTYPTNSADALQSMMESTLETSRPKVATPPSEKTQIKEVSKSSSTIFISDTLVNKLKDMFDNDNKLALSISAKIKAKISINISKENDIRKWIIDCTNTKEVPIIKLSINDEEDKAGVIISCTDETFKSLTTGSLSTEYAYMRGLLKVKGSMGLAMKMKTLLELMNSK